MKQKLNEFKKWDTHHHISPPFYEEFLRNQGIEDVWGLPHTKWSPKMMLAWMDEINVEKSVLSISMPGVHFGDDVASRKISRRCNDYMAELIKENPGRLGAFATLPLPDVEGAVEELKYALDELKFDGIGLLSNLNHHYLGDRSFEPVWEEANKREAVIYIHPTAAKYGIKYRLLNYTYYLKMDTAKTIIDFMRSGYHKKYPNIKFILSHGGGLLPAVMPAALEGLKRENPDIEQEFEEWRCQLFGDIALVTYPDETLPTSLNFFGANHMVYGSDLCWAARQFKYYIQKFSEFGGSRETFEDIYFNNVKGIFNKAKVPYKPFKIQPVSAKRNNGTVNHHSHINPEVLTEFVTGKTGMTVNVANAENAENEIKKTHNNSMLSMDMPELWSLGTRDRREALKLYNQTICKMKDKANVKVGVLAAIDLDDPDHSISEIDYCLNQLNMDGICLYVEITGKKYEDMFDEKLLQKLEQVGVPVVIHPKLSNDKPVIDRQYYDAVAFLFSLIYLDKFEHMKMVNYIPTHTSGLIDFLSHQINTMHYIDPTTTKPRIGKIIWEMIIKKQEVVHDYFRQMQHIY